MRQAAVIPESLRLWPACSQDQHCFYPAESLQSHIPTGGPATWTGTTIQYNTRWCITSPVVEKLSHFQLCFCMSLLAVSLTFSSVYLLHCLTLSFPNLGLPYTVFISAFLLPNSPSQLFLLFVCPNTRKYTNTQLQYSTTQDDVSLLQLWKNTTQGSHGHEVPGNI